jgi:hypothetical protein
MKNIMKLSFISSQNISYDDAFAYQNFETGFLHLSYMSNYFHNEKIETEIPIKLSDLVDL